VRGRWAALLLCAALAACAQQAPRPDAEGGAAGSAARTADGRTAAGTPPPDAPPATASAGDPPADTVAAPEIPDTDQIFFASNATGVDEAGRRKLRAHAERLKANRRLNVTLVGHTDHLGSRSYNLAIAERRTAAVAEVLTSLGVGRTQIRRYGVGSEKLGPPCQTSECRGRMRRVDLIYPD
jgi:outer membrane protein OmpA-like peptidoglycan-associated protein